VCGVTVADDDEDNDDDEAAPEGQWYSIRTVTAARGAPPHCPAATTARSSHDYIP